MHMLPSSPHYWLKICHISWQSSLEVASILLDWIRNPRGGDICRPIALILLAVSALSRSPIYVFLLFVACCRQIMNPASSTLPMGCILYPMSIAYILLGAYYYLCSHGSCHAPCLYFSVTNSLSVPETVKVVELSVERL